MFVDLANSLPEGTRDILTLDESDEWSQDKTRYLYYSICGTKIKFGANIETTAATGSNIHYLSTATFTDAIPAAGAITDANIRAKGDFQVKLGPRFYRRYRRLGWYWRQIGDEWVKTGSDMGTSIAQLV